MHSISLSFIGRRPAFIRLPPVCCQVPALAAGLRVGTCASPAAAEGARGCAAATAPNHRPWAAYHHHHDHHHQQQPQLARGRNMSCAAGGAGGREALADAVVNKEELVTVVDEVTNEPTGVVTRREVRASNLVHRASFVLVFNSEGKVFVQKRVSTKETFPSFFDPCPGGVVGVETYEENAARELEEEMGVKGVEITPCFDFFYDGEVCRLWGRLFSCIYDGPLTLQAEEVESGEWLTLEEARSMLDTADVCPDSALALRRYLDAR